MIPIHELFNRIRWDREFGRADFEIGYFDHIEQRIIRIPFREIYFEEGNHFSFQLLGLGGETVTIPFHRVRQVFRDGVLIWERTGA